MPETCPYGAWPSPITPELLVAGANRPTDVWAEGDTIWWSERRPTEEGRVQLVRCEPDGTVTDLLPDGWNARTRVHEYGGGAWWVHDGVVFFTRWDDQRVYRLEPGGAPAPVTPEPPEPHAWRYADGRCTPDGSMVVCVREAHEAGQVRNEIVGFPADGSAAPVVLAGGRDFVAAPRVSRDGRQLAWLAWDHPAMPWDATELWVGRLAVEGGRMQLTGARREAGGSDESLVQPEWGRHGQLFVVSDRSDWWNVYRVDGVDDLRPVYPVDAEVGEPAWVFGQSRYAVARNGTVVLTYEREIGAEVVVVPEDGGPRRVPMPAASLAQLVVAGDHLVVLATTLDHEPVVGRASITDPARIDVVRPARDLGLDPAVISRPEHIMFPTSQRRTAHAWFYPPVNPEVAAPEGELPPLLVMIHGGPTSRASPSFDLSRQFWTSRGFAVVDVDYGGSAGYGRVYRRQLDGAWGVVDVDDCCAAAEYLAAEGRVDRARMAIRGGSAGGFTTLAALATREVFSAGASMFGVADLGALARDTHKFESRYLDTMVGPWPEAEAVYLARSPLSHIDGFDRPLIVFQGLEDEVVPPAQSERIVAALVDKEVPHAYLAYEGEQHGFRRAENIVRTLTAELLFYGRVFGFEPAGDLEPIDIAFADRLA